MASFVRVATALSSVFLRLSAFVFFRWIPGHHFPPVIYSFFLIYLISFHACVLSNFRSSSPKSAVHKAKPGLANGHTAQPKLRSPVKNTRVSLKALITGCPSPTSIASSVATFTVNLALVALTVTCVYGPALLYPAHELSFARVGYVSESSAKIFLREPDSLKLPIHLSYRLADPSPLLDAQQRDFQMVWKEAASVDHLTNATDFTATLTLTDLLPDTRYQYALSNNYNGFFITAPPTGTTSGRHHAKFSFLHTSCIIPNFPYNPLAHPLTIPGLRFLSHWIRELRPAFMLFLGDFIYADVPLRHGSDVSTYRSQYRRVYASPEWASASKTSLGATFDGNDYDLPWLHTYDDHEIANDWSGNTTGYFPAAFDPYLHYHLGPNPPLPDTPENSRSEATSPLDPAFTHDPPTYSTFTQGPATCFLLDTRRYRQPPSPQSNSSMLGSDQRAALLAWLAAPAPPGVAWKILVSSVPFTKNWRVNAQDTWHGYLAERRIILEAMWTYASSGPASPAGIVVLSGDRHEFAATAFPAPPDSRRPRRWREGVSAVEFSTSPLSQFYLPVHTYRAGAPAAAGWLVGRLLGVKAAEEREDAGAARLRRGEEDVCLKYLPQGNAKFGVVEIEAPTGSGISLLRYRLFVDGVEAWSHVLGVGGPGVGTEWR